MSGITDDDLRDLLRSYNWGGDALPGRAADEIVRLRADLARCEALVEELREWQIAAFVVSNDLLAEAIGDKLERHGFGGDR